MAALKPNVELYSYQKTVCDWMADREAAAPAVNHGITGGLICLKMGLGKTLTAINHSLTYPGETPTLVITSKTVMYEWRSQGFEKFYGKELKVLYLHKDFISVDAVKSAHLHAYHFVISTYDLVLSTWKKGSRSNSGASVLYSMPWHRLILDESARVSNSHTGTFKACLAIPSGRTWCLTGTPIRNTDLDIFSQLRMCGYTGVKKESEWSRDVYTSNGLDRYVYECDYQRAEVTLPELMVHEIPVKMNTVQEDIYSHILLQTMNMFHQMLQGRISFANVLAMFTRLRQICIAPYLITTGKGHIDPMLNDYTGNAGIQSPKIQAVINIIKGIPKGEKVLVYSMFTQALNLIEKAIPPGIQYTTLTGEVTGPDRQSRLTDFKTGATQVMLIHYRVGSEGLNLTEANHVICIEPWWSPTVHSQAVTRCWRRGQTVPVHAYWLTVERSIEVPILKMCKNKEELSDYYLKGTEYKPMATGLTKDAMAQLLKGEPSNIGTDPHPPLV